MRRFAYLSATALLLASTQVFSQSQQELVTGSANTDNVVNYGMNYGTHDKGHRANGFTTDGGFAEYAVMQEFEAMRMPDRLSWEQAAGVPLVDALDSVAGAAGNAVYADATRRIRTDVSTGTSLSGAMIATNVFPNMVLQMTQIGEESGSLDHMLSKAAEFYEDEVDEAVKAADTLGVHRNTTAYRMRRIEELTGWDLREPDLRLALALALRILDADGGFDTTA